jgi:hypothetical protein
MMPKMPAMLETRFEPNNFPSCSLKSPEGRSTTKVAEEGEEGEEKA